MRCPRCLNEDPSYFYLGSKGWMCRRCVSFKRVLIMEEQEQLSPSKLSVDCAEYMLDYPLTPLQKIVAERCAKMIFEQDVLIEAICGARQDRIGVCNDCQDAKFKKTGLFCDIAASGGAGIAAALS